MEVFKYKCIYYALAQKVPYSPNPLFTGFDTFFPARELFQEKRDYL